MDKIVISIDSGNVTEVISNKPVQVIVIDRDTEGIDLEELCMISGKETYIYSGISKAVVNPTEVQQIMKEAGIKEIEGD